MEKIYRYQVIVRVNYGANEYMRVYKYDSFVDAFGKFTNALESSKQVVAKSWSVRLLDTVTLQSRGHMIVTDAGM